MYWVNFRDKNIGTTLEVYPGRFEVAQIIGAHKVMGDIYEISVEYIKMGGYHTWYALLYNNQFIFLTVAQYLTDVTKAIQDELWMQEELMRIEDRDRPMVNE